MKSSNKYIIFYTKDLNGGIAKFLENIIPLLEANDWKVNLICHQASHTYTLNPRFIGIKIDRQLNFSFFNGFKNFYNLVRLFFEIKNSPARIIYSLDLYANFNSLLVKHFLSNKVYVQSTRSSLKGYLSDRNSLLRAWIMRIIKQLYRRSDLHIVPSKGIREQLISLLKVNKNKVIYLPNFIDTKKIRALSFQPVIHQKNQGQINIFAMARFDKQKNIEKMFPIIAKNIKYHLFLLGDGPLKTKYQKTIMRLKISKQVIFLGWQNNPYRFLRQADAFILLSKYEGFPFTLLETLAIGLPTIAADVDFGPREILDNGKYGILIPNQNSKNIEASLKNALKNKSHLIKMAKKRAQDFDYKVVFPAYLELLKKLNSN